MRMLKKVRNQKGGKAEKAKKISKKRKDSKVVLNMDEALKNPSAFIWANLLGKTGEVPSHSYLYQPTECSDPGPWSSGARSTLLTDELKHKSQVQQDNSL